MELLEIPGIQSKERMGCKSIGSWSIGFFVANQNFFRYGKFLNFMQRHLSVISKEIQICESFYFCLNNI
jgi:hypothetical protein